MTARPPKFFILCLLGALSVVSPFAIDMYLPAFPEVARDFGVETAVISLTISSYFIGLALGQVFYGPLLDRFGRKRPLYAGLALFMLTAAGCVFAPTVNVLVGLRFIQGLGGCAAGVASLAIIQDLFPVQERARILSRLFLFIAASPLLAPSVGGMIALTFGWKAVFWLLAGLVGLFLALIHFFLPESHAPDPGISLKIGPILREYLHILGHKRFLTYTVAGAFSFAGLFAYVAGSPVIFMDGFHLSAKVYSGIFALLATGFIGASQVNVLLLRRWTSEQVFLRALGVQLLAGLVFLGGTLAGWYGLTGTLVLFFIYLSCAGLTYPNSAALALSPFTRNAGSASALLGFLQMGIGALVSTGIGVLKGQGSFPIIALLAATSLLGMILLLLGEKGAALSPAAEEELSPEAK